MVMKRWLLYCVDNDGGRKVEVSQGCKSVLLEVPSDICQQTNKPAF